LEAASGALAYLQADPWLVEVVIHPRYNPEGITQYNIVPGLLGVILTMTLVMITGVAMTRETERGTMENLLVMPSSPFEVMIGTIMPFLGVGAVQTLIVLLVVHWLFAVPFVGSISLLLMSVVLFIIANLALGFTFSTIAKAQIQALQLTVFFFLPSMLLSGFMFPFRGMRAWAQAIGEVLPLTHFLLLVRRIMLKGAGFKDLKMDLAAIAVFTLVVVFIAMLRYKRMLD
jgi:ABC-2 type transport system permease protein